MVTFVRSFRRKSRARIGAACSGAASDLACVVVSGIPGSGKSTLCRLLCGAVHNSAWFNQDNFVITGKKAKTTFLSSVKTGLRNALQQSSALVYVDKVNTLKAHRADILNAAEEVRWMEKGGLMLLCELTSNDLEYCMGRIESRGAAHKSLQPSAELKDILKRHSADYEPPDEEELEAFQQVQIDARMNVVEKALEVITALRHLGWSARLRPMQIAAAESEEWVEFPSVDDRPTFYWNRRTGESVWQKPAYVQPAFQGFPHRDKAYFRCVRTLVTMWELPPLRAIRGPTMLPSDLDGEEQLRFLLEAEWARLQCMEDSWRLAAGTAEKNNKAKESNK